MDYHASLTLYFIVLVLITRISTQSDSQFSDTSFRENSTNSISGTTNSISNINIGTTNIYCNNTVCDIERITRLPNSSNTPVSMIPSEDSVTETQTHVASVLDETHGTPTSSDYSTFLTEIPFAAIMELSTEGNNSAEIAFFNGTTLLKESVEGSNLSLAESSKFVGARNVTDTENDDGVTTKHTSTQFPNQNSTFPVDSDTAGIEIGNTTTNSLPSTLASVYLASTEGINFTDTVGEVSTSMNMATSITLTSSSSSPQQTTNDLTSSVDLGVTAQEVSTSMSINKQFEAISTMTYSVDTANVMDQSILNSRVAQTLSSEVITHQTETLPNISTNDDPVILSSTTLTSMFSSRINNSETSYGEISAEIMPVSFFTEVPSSTAPPSSLSTISSLDESLRFSSVPPHSTTTNLITNYVASIVPARNSSTPNLNDPHISSDSLPTSTLQSLYESESVTRSRVDSSSSTSTIRETSNLDYISNSTQLDQRTEFTSTLTNMEESISLRGNVTDTSSIQYIRTDVPVLEATESTSSEIIDTLNTTGHNVQLTEVSIDASKSSTISIYSPETQPSIFESSNTVADISLSPVQSTSSSPIEGTQTLLSTSSSEDMSVFSSTLSEITTTIISNYTPTDGIRSPRILPTFLSTTPTVTEDNSETMAHADSSTRLSVSNTTSSLSTGNVITTNGESSSSKKDEDEWQERVFHQINLDNLTNEDLEGVVTAIFRKPSEHCGQDWFWNQTAMFHYWVLHTIIEKIYVKQVNWSNIGGRIEIDLNPFLEAIEIMFITPTPTHTEEDLLFTFLVLMNGTSGPIRGNTLLSLLNSNAEQILNLLDVRQVRFILGPYDARAVEDEGTLAADRNFIRDNGVVIIAVSSVVLSAVITLLLFAICTRRKSRISVHCITDRDRFQQDMHIAVDIGDINSAVVILQDEIQEKPEIKNGKLFTVGDDEGWVVPINQRPLEEHNLPEVQDTKL